MSRNIMIIGAGGIGSFLIPLLDRTGLYDITVLDPDNVETKNLTYQNFKKGHVGQNKALVMRQEYSNLTKSGTTTAWNSFWGILFWSTEKLSYWFLFVYFS